MYSKQMVEPELRLSPEDLSLCQDAISQILPHSEIGNAFT